MTRGKTSQGRFAKRNARPEYCYVRFLKGYSTNCTYIGEFTPYGKYDSKHVTLTSSPHLQFCLASIFCTSPLHFFYYVLRCILFDYYATQYQGKFLLCLILILCLPLQY